MQTSNVNITNKNSKTMQNIGIVCENHLGIQYTLLPIFNEKPANIDMLLRDQRIIVYNKHDSLITLFYYDENNSRHLLHIDISDACADNQYVKLFIVKKDQIQTLYAYTTSKINKQYRLS